MCVVVGFAVRRSSERYSDAAVCRALSRLDGVTVNPTALPQIHDARARSDTRLGHIARDADGTCRPGHLFLVSEDYDFAVQRCDDLGIEVSNID